MANLDLAKQIEVIRREPGFLRLSLPAYLCDPAHAQTIEQQMAAQHGIQSASLDAGWRRLSIRFDPSLLQTHEVARLLFGMLEPLANTVAPSSSLTDKLPSMVSGALSETSVINFLNDITAFYLVKAHWELITKKWLKQPALYSNAWLTTFYLIFLLIRYRKRSANQAANSPANTPANTPNT